NRAMMPEVSATYPEYITDVALYICPSDADPAPMYGNDGEPIFASMSPTENQYAFEKSDNSYSYQAWVLDQCNDDDPSAPAVQIRYLEPAGGTSDSLYTGPNAATARQPVQYQQLYLTVFD